MAAKPTSAADAKQDAWDEFVHGLLTDPAKVEAFRKECDEKALKQAPHMTQAQLDASWEFLRQQMGF